MLCVRCVIDGLVTRKDTSVWMKDKNPSMNREVLCSVVCMKWFKHKGGLAVHRCILLDGT